MTAAPKKKNVWLRILPAVLVPIAFVVALPWLKSFGNPLVILVTAAAASLFVVTYANYLSYRFQSCQDEVQQASAGFAAQWGAAAGQTVFIVLLSVPPFLDFATAVVRRMLGDPGASEKVVILAMTIGFCCLVLLQAVGTVVVRTIWWRVRS